MDTRLRLYSRRAAAMNGGPNDEALLLMECVRCGEIERMSLMLAAAAGIPAANLALGIRPDAACNALNGVLPAPSNNLFEPIVEQVKVVWDLNNRLRWGFTASDFASLPVPTARPTGGEHNLATPILTPCFDAVQEDVDNLWHAIEARHANTWRWEELKSDSLNLKLLDGIVHPGRCLRWETIDLAANWDQENGIRPRDVRNAQSPHAGILAAAAIHTRWVEAMDGETVPYVWLPGYQCLFDGHWSAVPWLSFDQNERQVQLDHLYDGYHDGDGAVPGPVGE